MFPWEYYAPPDPRADPANWAPNGIYIGPNDYEPDYHGGTISTEYYPSPTIFAPGSIYRESGNEYGEAQAVAPATTAPPTAPLVPLVPADARWAPVPSIAPPTAPSADAPALPAASTPNAAPPIAPLAVTHGDGDATIRAGDSRGTVDWPPPGAAIPGVVPREDRWTNPIFGRYFRTVRASNPAWARLIRSLPQSALSARPRDVGGRQPGAPFGAPAAQPRRVPATIAPEERRVLQSTAPPAAPGGSASSQEALAAVLALRARQRGR